MSYLLAHNRHGQKYSRSYFYDRRLILDREVTKEKINKIKKKKKFLRFEEEKDLLKRIEKVRQELHSMLKCHDCSFLDDETIEISQYLDRLLVRYIKEKYIGND